MGTTLALRVCLLCREVAWNGGCCMIEHPRDLGPPAPSIFHRGPISTLLADITSSRVVSFDQCRFGCHARKPTSVWAANVELGGLSCMFCDHPLGHANVIGWSTSHRGWRTSPLAQYPKDLCAHFAAIIIKSLSARLRNHLRPRASHGDLGRADFESRALLALGPSRQNPRVLSDSVTRFQN